MKDAISFGRLFLFSPTAAADACRKDDAPKKAFLLFLVWAAAALASSWFNPLSFLDPTSPVGRPQSLGFWLRVAFWEPVIFVMGIAIAGVVLEWMRDGWLPLKTASATLWSAVPVVAAIYFTSAKTPLPRAPFIVALALWAAAGAAVARRVPTRRWRDLAVFLAGMCAIELAGFAVEYAVVVPAHSFRVFIAYSVCALLWMLVCAGVGLKKLCGMSTARATLAFMFSMLVSAVVPAIAFLLGLMPMEVLKVALYV